MKVPPNACDCHVHLFGPAARYPLAAARTYTPPDASIDELVRLQERLGFERVVVVQPSVYGTDNSCMLDAVQRLGPRARGVVVVDSSISNSELGKMHQIGVRGVRVNLQTEGVRDAATAQRLLEEAAARAAPLGWHVQVFAGLRLLRKLSLEELEPVLVVDHFGAPQDKEDARFLLSQLRRGNTYVKLSGPHRSRLDPGRLARELAGASPERCLWGSDWPHPASGRRDPATVQPFDAIDDLAALERIYRWVGDDALFRKILVENPARLYDF